MPKKSYDLLTWIPHLLLFYKEKVFRKLLPIMVIITLYEFIIGFFFPHIARLKIGQFHIIFSFILTIIISFRVNVSYNRWWEGRTLWGAIVNNCRNITLRFDVYFDLKKHPEFLDLMQKFPAVVTANLRQNQLMLDELLFSLKTDKQALIAQPVVFLAHHIYAYIHKFRDGSIERMQQCALLESNIANLMDMIGGCERIAKTPVPPAFAFFVKQALLFYVLMFPFGWLDTFGLLIIPMMLMMIYVLLGLEILSEELEEPFLAWDNGLKLDTITQTIQANIEQIGQHN
ncbi:MAG: hypothetical protein CMF38_02800 [Legionellaceae bacterium]|nr:hypothetical protein [Legionellaceae bacterium]HCA89514.1 hypothetical protein [Legionellales bacterium]|tara:strand:+ start:592 stop:1452 length:861 start_codon:yes stop_codon:yes gene_type:complete